MKKLFFKISKIDKIFLLFFIVVVFSISGLLLFKSGFHNYEEVDITYKEDKDIDYKVYLKENDFFKEEYLESNKTYIASLIDYVSVDFDYTIDLSEKLSGTYTYYLKGIVEAFESNSDNSYYTRDFALTEVKTNKYNNKDSLTINESFDINYDKYNDILKSFKDEYNVSMDGNLKVVLVITNMIDGNSNIKDKTKTTELELNIPLTSLTIEVPINADSKNSEGILETYRVDKTGTFYVIARVLSIFSYIVAFLSLIYLIYLTVISYKLESIYNKKLRKILKTYDSIIVNVKTMPNINKSKMINVSSFEELIDAHSEVRKPINYIKALNCSTFLLISDNYIYSYKLEREVFTKGRDKE